MNLLKNEHYYNVYCKQLSCNLCKSIPKIDGFLSIKVNVGDWKDANNRINFLSCYHGYLIILFKMDHNKIKKHYSDDLYENFAWLL